MAYVVVAVIFIGAFRAYDVCKDSILLTIFLIALVITAILGIIVGAVQASAQDNKKIY